MCFVKNATMQYYISEHVHLKLDISVILIQHRKSEVQFVCKFYLKRLVLEKKSEENNGTSFEE